METTALLIFGDILGAPFSRQSGFVFESGVSSARTAESRPKKTSMTETLLLY
jgi:hypothetical protein